MKRIFLSLVALVYAIGGFAQTRDLTEFIIHAPWGLSVGNVLEQIEGVTICPTAEALSPSPVPTVEIFAEEYLTIAGFTIAGHDAYLTAFTSTEEEPYWGYVAFLSPKDTKGDMSTFNELVEELDSRLGPATGSFNRNEELAEGAYVYMGGMWVYENSLISPFCILMPEESEDPVLFGYMVANLSALMEEEESEYTEAPAEVTEEVPTEEIPLSPQDIAHFALNAPWGCGAEEVAELFWGRTTSLESALTESDYVLDILKKNIVSDFIVTGYQIADFDVLLNIRFRSEMDNILYDAQAIILPQEGVTTSEGINLLTDALSLSLGTPGEEFLEESPLEYEGDKKRITTRVWVTEKSVIYLSVIYDTSDPETPIFFLFNLYDTPYIFAYFENLEEQAAESGEGEPKPEGVLEENLIDLATADQNHFQFRGISFNKPLGEFCAAMENLGYTTIEDISNEQYAQIWMKGYYGDKACDVAVTASPLYQKVFCVSIVFVNDQQIPSWSSLRKLYDTYKRRLTNKFGEPDSVTESFDEYYEEGSGLEIMGIENGKNVFYCEFLTKEGVISINIEAYDGVGSVIVRFFDKINYLLNEQEIESLM